MLSLEDNDLLCRIGPGAPMGNLLRRFWVPALLSEEAPEPDSPPVRVRLLGEDLVAFRDTSGAVGLLQARCPHRRAHLFFARNEECGLRCVYHGWKFDIDGACVDMPSEPPESNFKEKIRAVAYPTQERSGVVWAYLGPRELTPQLPDLGWTRVPQSHVHVTKCVQQCSYMQALEGGIDSSHISFLHRRLDLPQYSLTISGQGDLVYAFNDGSPRFFLKETDHGLLIGARRDATENAYWRITPWFLPFHMIVPAEEDAVMTSNSYVPIDDENTMVFRVSWNPDRPLTATERAEYEDGGYFHEEVAPGTYRPLANMDNDYLMDREMQRTYNFTGIWGIQAQDMAVIEGMGAIVDRSQEHLGTSDSAIIAARRRLLSEARSLLEGVEPYAASHGEVYRARSIALVTPNSASLDEAAKATQGADTTV